MIWDPAAVTATADNWEGDALCAVEPANLDERQRLALFFPDDTVPGMVSAVAVAICWRCPVREQCLADALGWPADMDHGVRGGFTEEERWTMRRDDVGGRRRSVMRGGEVAERVHPGHGTQRGYKWELRYVGETCSACKAAHARHRLGRERARGRRPRGKSA